MGKKITFLHTADIHLGAPVRGLRALDRQWAVRMQAVIAESYERVIRTALQRKVDFVVLAGDAFDTSRASYADYLLFFDELQKLDDAGIPVYLVTGNHDPYTSWSKDVERLPPNCHLLGVDAPTFELFERAGEPLCLIGGRSYFNQTWPHDQAIAEGITREAAVRALSAESPRAADAPFSVGIIHTGLEIDLNKAPAREADLLASGIDFWACGHLHKRLVRPSQANPRIVFPGCVQGRDIKETGERGCYLVTLEQDRAPRIEFVPTASVVLQSVKVDVSTSRTLADMQRHVQSELFRENGKARCEEMVVRVELTGETELHEFLVQPDVLEGVRKQLNGSYPSFFCATLVNNTRPAHGRPFRAHDDTFPSLVANIADDQRRRDENMVNYIQSEFVKRGVAVPGSLTHRIGDFNDAAEQLVLDLLNATMGVEGGAGAGAGLGAGTGLGADAGTATEGTSFGEGGHEA